MSRSLVGKEVCFTGRLASMTRTEAEQRIENAGGRHVSFPAVSTSFLVIGDALLTGNQTTKSLSAFKVLKETGAGIELIREIEFLGMIRAEDELSDFRRMYTPAQVSRIVNVPLCVVRTWIRHGLLRPARTENKLSWFEYGDILIAGSLSKLSAAGFSATDLIRSLSSIVKWYPDGDRILSSLSAAGNWLLVRLSDGGWADPSGQRLLDFLPQSAARISDIALGSVGWFARAVDAEERGDLETAVAGYSRALEGSPDAVAFFNLGNVFFELGRECEAAKSYLAALDLDDEYVEAWNNLGNALAALGQDADAVRAYTKALEIEPEYPDAHCNIAIVLENLGRREEAESHRIVCEQAYPPPGRLRLVRGEEDVE